MAKQIVDATDSLNAGRGKINDNFNEVYSNNRVYNVKEYGAIGDQQRITDGGITSGTAVLTSASNPFVAGDVGKAIRVYGAGVSGTDLITTIASYQSAGQVTIAVNASTTVTGTDVKWGTACTSAIQAAHQAAFDAGGGLVFFPLGAYIINGALLAPNNSQLQIPHQSNADQKLVHVEWVGESPVNQIQDSKTGGVILESWISGSGTRPRVIGVAGVTGNFNYSGFSAKNIRIRVKSKTGASHVAPSMTAWGMLNMYNAWFENCFADTESTEAQSVSPAVNTIGFEMPAINNTTNSGGTIVRCVVNGYYKGFELSDHAKLYGTSAVYCFQGYSIQSASQPILIERALALNCKYNIVFEGGAPIKITQLAIENITTGGGAGSWNVITQDIYAASAVTSYGSITYSKNSVLLKSGTFGYVNFQSIKEGLGRQILMGGMQTLQSGGVGDWDGSTDKPVFQMRNDSPHSTDLGYADFTQDVKITGLNNAAGRWAVRNQQSAQTNKYLGYIYMYTKGAVDKGEWQIYAADGAGVGRLIMDISADYIRNYRPVVIDNDITPAALAANTDNYAPTGIANAATLRISASVAVDLTGIAGGTTMVDGRELTVINVGTTNTITLKNDITSTAANRFLLNADFALAPNMACKLVYDGTSARWRKVY